MHASLAGSELTVLSPSARPNRVQPYQLSVRMTASRSPNPTEVGAFSTRLEHLQPRLSRMGGGNWELRVTVLAESDAAARAYMDRMLGSHGKAWISAWTITPE